MSQPIPEPPIAERQGAALRDRRRWVRRSDQLARVAITAGGIGIVVAVLLILVLIVSESVPLWLPAKGKPEAVLRFAGAAADPVLLVFPDPYRETYVALRASGMFQQVDRKSAKVLRTTWAPGGEGRRIVSARRIAGRDVMALGFDDGRVRIIEARVRVDFSPDGRFVDLSVGPAGETALLPEGRPVRVAAAATREEGTVILGSSGGPDLHFAFLPAVEESEFPESEPAPAPIVQDLSPALDGAAVTAIAVSDSGEEAVVGTDRGEILPLAISEDGTPVFEDPAPVEPGDPAAVTAAEFLLGGQSVAVGDEKGRVSSWFRVREPENPAQRPYRRIHSFERMPSAVTAIGISTRNKGFATADRGGRLWLRHNTTERTVLKFSGRGEPAADAGISSRGDGAFLLSNGGLLSGFAVANPHPETTLRTLFGKVWYEGYDRPEFVWQSTGGTDDFEPKLSLTPLVYGTLKATFYALLFAIPAAIAAALYASVFAHRNLRKFVKPVVEIMAALPSVVIGFLAGLWLAPRVERTTVGTLLLVPVFLLAVVLAAIGWRALPARSKPRLSPWGEMLLLLGLVAAGAALAYLLGPVVERTAFGGDFKAWLFENFRERYDPRNSLVIGFAMGFAVVPIIFTISEDAFSNVPAHLSAASLALGASRWQTAVRVVLPTASPGVFSAVMVGFGRAIGETMIVPSRTPRERPERARLGSGPSG